MLKDSGVKTTLAKNGMEIVYDYDEKEEWRVIFVPGDFTYFEMFPRKDNVKFKLNRLLSSGKDPSNIYRSID